MLATIVAFVTLLLAALTAGTMFGVWLGTGSSAVSPATYVAVQQQLIGAMNVVMPLLGLATIVMTLVSAAVAHRDPERLALSLAAAACFLAAGLVTRLRNQPINAIVMTWAIAAPPPGWEQLRDRWSRWHVARTVSALAGLCLLIAAALVPAGVA